MTYIDTALLAGIFWRMGGFQHALNTVKAQVARLSKRVNEVESKIEGLA